MKAVSPITTNNSASSPPVANGRVSRRRDVENEEIQMYLSKLKELVPFMPRNRKLTKLEVIQHVIEYICDLQDALVEGHESPVVIRTSTGSPSRTPLGVLAPNTILAPGAQCSTQESTSTILNQDKKSSESKSTIRPARPVSC